MKELDGMQVYKKIKEACPSVKVFVFTGMEVDSNKFRSICPSFTEHQLIKKPVRVDTMIKIMKGAIANQR